MSLEASLITNHNVAINGHYPCIRATASPADMPGQNLESWNVNKVLVRQMQREWRRMLRNRKRFLCLYWREWNNVVQWFHFLKVERRESSIFGSHINVPMQKEMRLATNSNLREMRLISLCMKNMEARGSVIPVVELCWKRILIYCWPLDADVSIFSVSPDAGVWPLVTTELLGPDWGWVRTVSSQAVPGCVHNTGLRLVQPDHVTSTLAADWSQPALRQCTAAS